MPATACGKTNIGKLEINRHSFGWRSYQTAQVLDLGTET
jgi:hypothetical protein